jgi:hypothetical protein
MFNNAMLTDNQVRILRENKRICEEYKRYWKPDITRDAMFSNIAYALQLPITTVSSRITQMAKGGVKFPPLRRKQRASVVMPVSDLNAIFAVETETVETETEETEETQTV